MHSWPVFTTLWQKDQNPGQRVDQNNLTSQTSPLPLGRPWSSLSPLCQQHLDRPATLWPKRGHRHHSAFPPQRKPCAAGQTPGTGVWPTPIRYTNTSALRRLWFHSPPVSELPGVNAAKNLINFGIFAHLWKFLCAIVCSFAHLRKRTTNRHLCQPVWMVWTPSTWLCCIIQMVSWHNWAKEQFTRCQPGTQLNW